MSRTLRRAVLLAAVAGAVVAAWNVLGAASLDTARALW